MIVNVFSVIVSVCSFLYTTYILYRLTYFLSSHDIHIDSDNNTQQTAMWCLLWDLWLFVAFMFQHSILARNQFKQICWKLHIEHLSRSIYNICNSATIHFLVNHWRHVPSYVWHINTSSNAVWIFFTGLHVFAWSFIYSGCIMMDIAELLGLKQVFYRVSGRNSPLDNKSEKLKRYMQHMRHPSFTGFVIILWLYPFMSLDRIILASVMTVYMALMWTMDLEDYNYHVRYFQQKRMELS